LIEEREFRMTRQETWRKVEGAEKDWRSKRIAPVMILSERSKRIQKKKKKIMTGAIRSQIFFFFFFFFFFCSSFSFSFL